MSIYYRDYIDTLICQRLNRNAENEASVDPQVFHDVLTKMSPVITRVTERTKIPGFTQDDLESYLFMKTHQILRRNQWDRSRPVYGVFSVAYTNLIRDIVRMRNRCLIRGMHGDGLDNTLPFFESSYTNGVYDVLEE
jgi:hypothetical protein